MKFSALCMAFAATVLTTQITRAEEPDTELGKQMEAAGDAFKAINKETDPAKGAELARKVEAALLKCLAEIPAKVAKGPEADKAKQSAAYRTQMGELYVTFSKIEEAFLANDLAAVKTLADQAKAEKKDGHGKFIDKEKK